MIIHENQESDQVGSDFRIWEGIYDDFPEEYDAAFLDGAWPKKHADEVAAALALLDMPVIDCAFSQATLVHEYPLPTLAALVAAGLDRRLCILDFGGGAAASYPAVAGSLPDRTKLEFHVVELPALAERGRILFASRPRVRFHETLPSPASHNFDIVHVGAALQYIRDWRGLLESLVSFGPEWFALSNALAGPIRTFVTRQNIYGRQIPVRFLNIKELISEFHNLGYSLIYQSLMELTILGRKQPLPTSHFPPEHRLRYGCNLIFHRVGSRDKHSK